MINFDTFGRIYFPDPTKDEIVGVRLYSEDSKIFIEFEFPFTKKPQRQIIFIGDFNKLGKVTCLYNTYYEGNFGSGGNLCRYRVGYMISGKHFLNIEDIKFTKASIPATSLVEWFNIKTIKLAKEPVKAIQYGFFKEIKINTDAFDDVKFAFRERGWFKLDLDIYTKFGSFGIPYKVGNFVIF